MFESAQPLCLLTQGHDWNRRAVVLYTPSECFFPSGDICIFISLCFLDIQGCSFCVHIDNKQIFLFLGLCYRIFAIHWEVYQFLAPFMDVCILLLRVCVSCIPLLGVFPLLLGAWLWMIFLVRYKWNFNEVALDKRLNYFQSYWPFFAGFGNIFIAVDFYKYLHLSLILSTPVG